MDAELIEDIDIMTLPEHVPHETFTGVVISTAHLAREENEWLLQCRMNDTFMGCWSSPFAYGHLLHVSPLLLSYWIEKNGSDKEFVDRFPNLVRILKWARENEYGLIQLDQDGEVLDELPYHDW